ncbi:MAG: hypothetical protein NUK65_00710 [Firmicutes bacterium]|nr:hypothetical protein [Bacillota bacterium]
MDEGNREQTFTAFWDAMLSKLPLKNAPQATRDMIFSSLLKEVVQEWQVAINHFNEVREPATIDATIEAMSAIEKKYSHLLQKARQCGYRVPVTMDGFEERRKFLL